MSDRWKVVVVADEGEEVAHPVGCAVEDPRALQRRLERALRMHRYAAIVPWHQRECSVRTVLRRMREHAAGVARGAGEGTVSP